MNDRGRQLATAERIGFAVRKRRKLLGVTQQALARMAGCGLVFVYNIEHGKPSLRLDKLLDVLSALDLELVVASGSCEANKPSPSPSPSPRSHAVAPRR